MANSPVKLLHPRFHPVPGGLAFRAFRGTTDDPAFGRPHQQEFIVTQLFAKQHFRRLPLLQRQLVHGDKNALFHRRLLSDGNNLRRMRY